MRVQQTTTLTRHEYTYTCHACAHRQQARIEAVGIGNATALNAAGTGEARAAENAMQTAIDTMAFVPCPKCGKTNEELASQIRRKFYLVAIGLPAVITLGVVGFATYMAKGIAPWIALATGGVLFVFVAGLTVATAPKAWSRAEERTTFLDPPGT